MVELLMTRTDVHANAVDCHSYSPLWLAARAGHLEVARRLLKHHTIDRDHQKADKSPLVISIIKGYLDIATLLLRQGGRLGVNISEMALLLGARRGYPRLVSLILEDTRIKPNCVDSKGRTPLF